MLAFSNDYYGFIFRATQSIELFCAYQRNAFTGTGNDPFPKRLPADPGAGSEKVSEFEKRYQKILETARKEYRDIPANDYYRDGYNLFLRMEKYMQNHLLFLHNSRVPATNNEAERLLRNYKRKQAQAVTFRSFESIDYLCQCMSMLVLMRLEESANIFDRVSKIFG